jgi:molecular chaperone DnaK (HSP70)
LVDFNGFGMLSEGIQSFILSGRVAVIQFLTIPFDDLYAGVGIVDLEYPADTRLKPQRPWNMVSSYGLMAYWPKKESWLKLDLLAQSSSAGPVATFGESKEILEHVCRQHGVDHNRIAPAGFLNSAEIRVGSLTQQTQVTIRLLIDTSAESFRAAALRTSEGSRTELVQKISVRLFDTKSLNANFEQTGEITLILRPAVPVPAYTGVVAIDIGNTSSDLACISRRDRVYSTQSIQLLDAEQPRPQFHENPRAMQSTVRFDRVNSPADLPAGTRRFPDATLPKDDLPSAVDYVAGRLAVGQGVGPMPGLVLGAKRLVSGQAAEGYRKLLVQHRRGTEEAEREEEVEIQNRVPAELLACRLLEKFRAAANAWPGELILTYPTTYTPRELDRLTQAVERGWLRMLGQSQRLGEGTFPEDPDLARLVSETQAHLMPGAGEGPPMGLIREKLDEATAAAFFFLYRDIFESPGGLLRFRYLYPNGMNALLYDCGGGTTDIALVHAHAPSPNEIAIEVLKRTGLRGFGGDDMTRAVARILKGKLLAELLRLRGKVVPASSGNVIDDASLQKLQDLDPNDQLVPTRFQRNRFDADTLRRRRNALELWSWAEKLKVALGEQPENGSVKFEGVLLGRDALAESIYQGMTPQQIKAAEVQLKTIQLTRKSVDLLIDSSAQGAGPVTRSIDKCNRLIQQVLRDGKVKDGKPEEEIHRVILSGNASRYPLIRDRMKSLLQVDDWEERLLFEVENLKHSVAKGAALYLTTTRTPGLQVIIRTQANLSDCLPFDVGYFDLGKRTHKVLFQEHSRYKDLPRETVPIKAAVIGEQSRTFALERRFPGDDEFSRFVSYDFPGGIQGDLEVSYDASSHQFVVKDLRTDLLGTPTDLTDSEVYIAPPERGDV